MNINFYGLEIKSERTEEGYHGSISFSGWALLVLITLIIVACIDW